MVVVAVAGGLGDTGRTIAEEMLKRNDHEIYVLSRKVSRRASRCGFQVVLLLLKVHIFRLTNWSKTHAGAASRKPPENFAPIITVDYASVDAIREVLTEKNVDTVICTMNLHYPGAAESQINLIRAAAQSGVVKKFLPSEFNIDYGCPAE